MGTGQRPQEVLGMPLLELYQTIGGLLGIGFFQIARSEDASLCTHTLPAPSRN